LDHLPQYFFEALAAPKWTERRDILQEVVNIVLKRPRLDPNLNYIDLLGTLKGVCVLFHFILRFSCGTEKEHARLNRTKYFSTAPFFSFLL
uniref:Dynein_AAA_lid domain-containing protein n=1 Tax=Gongylonema pulchrum TaxID=637853 RepID=A0A183D999_9BILA